MKPSSEVRRRQEQMRQAQRKRDQAAGTLQTALLTFENTVRVLAVAREHLSRAEEKAES